MLAGTEGGSLVSLSVTTASGQLLQGAGNAGAINMLPTEGASMQSQGAAGWLQLAPRHAMRILGSRQCTDDNAQTIIKRTV